MRDVDRTPPFEDGSSPAAGGVTIPPRAVRSRSRGSAWRALIASAVSAILLVAMLGVAAFAQSGRGAAGPTFLPADTVAYAELRLDLPGDQRDNLMALLGHLPGFADAAAFDTKLDTLLDQMLGGSGSPLSWTEDIKPWFGGQVMIGLPELPPMGLSTSSAGDAASTPVLLGLAASDAAALDAAVTKVLASHPEGVTSQEHGGTTISIVATDADQPTVIAPTDTVLLLSNDVTLVESAIDVLGGAAPSLAEDADYLAAVATLPADRLGAVFLDTTQFRDALAPLLGQGLGIQPDASADPVQPDASAAPVPSMANLAFLPPWVAGAITAQPDSLTALIGAPVVEGGPTLAIRSTDLAAKMPPDSVLYLEVRDLGVTLKGIVEQIKPMLAAQGNEKVLDQFEALLGTGLESYLDWVQDVAVAASIGIAGPSIGIAATVTDEAVGAQRLMSLLTLVRAISATADPSPVQITSEDVDGVTVTTIALTESGAGLPAGMSISVAIGDGHLYLGLGDFAKDALSRDAADSLAAAPGFTKAVAAAGEANGGLLYLDVASAISLAESTMSAADRERFDAQVKPFAEALDFVVASLGQSDTSTSVSLMLFVK